MEAKEARTEALPQAPRIVSWSWGRIEVEGKPPFKDAKVFPGGAREWDWRETGTQHSPGIQPADVEELVARGARAVVLSRGVLGRLQVMPETLEWLAGRGIDTHVLKTEEAIELFNKLRLRGPTGGLFHTTC